ncbi:MAG: hypothetical protein IPP67_00185 [Rhodospirillaceae bacterium]|nr:hypothetical protein [Rhodospirillaceae bacterium]
MRRKHLLPLNKILRKGRVKLPSLQVSKPETVNQLKQQEIRQRADCWRKATTPSANQATHQTSEAKNSPTGEPTKPDQQVTPQQPSSEAKTNQAAVSQSQSPQSAGRSEALQKSMTASNQTSRNERHQPSQQRNKNRA